MRRLVEWSASIAVVIMTAVAGLPALSSAADSITISLGATDYLPGQRLLFNGFSLSRSAAVDVYMGIALAGNGGIAFIDPAAKITFVADLEAPASIPRLASFPAAPFMNFPGFYFPTKGLNDGTYDLLLFIASVTAGALQDNVFAPGELLAVDVRPITLTYSREPRFEFEASVSSGQRALVEQAVSQTRDFLSVSGVPDFGAATIFVADTLTALAQQYAKWYRISIEEALQHETIITGAGEGGLGVVFLKTPIDASVVYHELFHVSQSQLIGGPLITGNGITTGDFVPTIGPTWFIEGSAVYFQDLTANHYGLYDFTQKRNARLQLARGTSAPLMTLEKRTGIQAVGPNIGYSLGFAAVDFLLPSGSIFPLLEFWRRIGEGVSWPEAFTQVFGRSIEVFYQQFEAYRRTAFPPL